MTYNQKKGGYTVDKAEMLFILRACFYVYVIYMCFANCDCLAIDIIATGRDLLALE